MCSHTYHNAFQFWYFIFLYGKPQGLFASIHIIMLFSFGTLIVCMATFKAQALLTLAIQLEKCKINGYIKVGPNWWARCK